MSAATVNKTVNGFCLSGIITFGNIRELRHAGDVLIRETKKQDQTLLVNLIDVKNSHASTLALLLAWLRTAKQKQICLSFVNLPESLKRMQITFGLQSLISVDDV